MSRAAGGMPSGGRSGLRSFAPIDPSRIDWILLGSCIAIAAFGLAMVYSASRNIDPDDPYYYVIRQSMAIAIGALVITFLLRFDYRKFRDYSLVAYLVTAGLLLLVLTPVGSKSNGATSWFELPFNFQLQPSELAKFGLIVALAGYVNEHRGDIDPWRFTVIVGLAVVPIGLVQLQPDLGTNMVLLAIVIGLLAVGGVPGRFLVVLGLLGLTAIYAVISLGILKEYQLDRLAIGGGGADAQGSAYNQRQSTQTIGAGGVDGQGYLNGSNTRLGFVPEQQTDFIFTAVGEEFGFLGCSLLLALFAIVLWRTWRIAQLSRDYYGTLVCGGVLAMFTFMIFENMGMAMGIMPVAGIPLPFMSYGGSSIIACSACIGLVLNVHAYRFE